MKNSLKIVLIFVAVLLLCFALTACNKGEDEIIEIIEEIDNVTVNFSVDGVVYETIDIAEGSTVRLPQNPTKEGYTFDGWYIDEALITSYTEGTLFADNITIYAKWKANKYSVTFNTNGGSAISPIILDYGALFTLPANPTKTGYDFITWDNTITSMPASDLTLNAVWSIKEFTVSFDSNYEGVVNPSSKTVTYNSAIGELPEISCDGLDFLNWYYEGAEGEEIVYNNETVYTLNTDITLKCKWIPTVTNLYLKNSAMIKEAYPKTTYHEDAEEYLSFMHNYFDYNLCIMPMEYIICYDARLLVARFENIDEAQIILAIIEAYGSTDAYMNSYYSALQKGNLIYYGANEAINLFLNNAYLEDDIYYTENGDGYSLTSYLGYASDVIIPQTVNGKTVNEIGCGAFTNTNIKSVTIPSGVTRINSSAFEYCNYLKTVIISEGSVLNYIGINAFGYCKMVNSINLPDTVTCIDQFAFYYCDKLAAITLPAQLTYIGAYAFYNAALTTLTVPACVETIDINAFNCQNLTEVIFEADSSLIDINAQGFNSSPWYINQTDSFVFVENVLIKINSELSGAVTLPSNTVGIANYAFYGFSNITEITIPSGVKFIGESAFSHCTNLSVVTFEAGSCLESIGEYAFYYCQNLDEINIPANVVSIGENAFEICSVLVSINVDTENEFYSSKDGILFDKDKTILLLCPSYNGIGEYHIPSSVTIINENAFKTCNVTVVYLGDNVTEIESYAFSDCSRLVSVNFAVNGKLERIEEYAFCYCSKLTDIAIPDSITYLGKGAFYYCSGITTASLPQDLKVINDYLFYYCSGLTTISLPSNLKYIGADAFEQTALTQITLPESMEIIGSCAFYGSGLTEIHIPDGVKYIGMYAFSDCSDLTVINIPEGLEIIEDGLFQSCSSLTSIVLPESVRKIKYSAFADCSMLNGINIPEGIEVIESNAFSNCIALESIVIPTGIDINETTFYNCTALTTVSLSDDTLKINSCAFYDCRSLTNINFPTSLLSIGSTAFGNCYALVSITLPDSLNNMDSDAFLNCTGLTTVELSDNLLELESYVFNGCSALANIGFSDNTAFVEVTAFQGTKWYNDLTANFTGALYIGKCLYKYFGAVAGEYTVIDGTKYISGEAFSGQSILIAVTIPDSVTEIGESAFRNCYNLAEVNFGVESQLKIINTYAFGECTGLSTFTIPESVTTLNSYAFYNTGLVSITIPEAVTILPYCCFGYNTYLTEVIINKSISNNKDMPITYYSFYNSNALTSIYVPVDSFYIYLYSTMDLSNVVGKLKHTGFYVTFETMGGECANSQLAVEANSYIETQTAYMAGYRFVGWYTQPSEGVEFDFTTPITSDTYLYAVYDEDTSECTMTFDSMGGAEIDAVTKIYGNKIAAPDVAANGDLVFDGWYFDEEFTQSVSFPYTITSSITVFTKWVDVKENGETIYTAYEITENSVLYITTNVNYYYFIPEDDGEYTIILTVNNQYYYASFCNVKMRYYADVYNEICTYELTANRKYYLYLTLDGSTCSPYTITVVKEN